MAVRVKKSAKSDIPVSEMKDGNIAVITDWSKGLHTYTGKVVQRCSNRLVTLGEPSDQSWGENIFDGSYNDCRVRILSPGTTLIIE